MFVTSAARHCCPIPIHAGMAKDPATPEIEGHTVPENPRSQRPEEPQDMGLPLTRVHNLGCVGALFHW